MAKLLRDLGSEDAIPRISGNALIERDLGIDSLGKVELFHIIEDHFHCRLPISLLYEVETLGELTLALMERVDVKSTSPQTAQPLEAPSHQRLFIQADTFIDSLYAYAKADPLRPHIYLQDDLGNEKTITFGDLLNNAQKVAQGLIERGLEQAQTVAIILPTCEAFFEAFLGIQLAGGIPVPIYPPMQPHQLEEYVRREAKVLQNAQAQFLISFTPAKRLNEILKSFIPTLKEVVTVPHLKETHSTFTQAKIIPEDSAVIQYTSGSTGDPKGVLLTHANIVANLRAMDKVIHVKPTDVIISWLPLYHDMGLIGTWLASLYFGIPVVIMSPLVFLSRPERWLWAIHTHRGTLSAAPNFGYELCVQNIKDKDIEGLDLSSWRVAINGSESVLPSTLRHFHGRFKHYGFKEKSLYPAYGLAEASVGLTVPTGNKKPQIDSVDRKLLEKTGKAVKTKGLKNSTKIVSCGMALPDHEIKIVDDNGKALPDREIGSLWFKGPSMMKGYYRNPTATNKMLHNGWIDTTDLAYQADGEIYIVGRKKDLIIKAGRNLYPQDIEEVVNEVSGVRTNCSCAFSISHPIRGTEELIIVAETDTKDVEKRKEIASEITAQMSDFLSFPPDHVVMVDPDSIPKTINGKLQRSACKAAYLNNELGYRHAPVWYQFSKIYLQSYLRKAGYGFSFLIDGLYTIYILLLIAVLSLPCLMTLILLPLKIAQKTGKLWAKILFALSGTFFGATGKHLQKDKTTIYVANHASFIDAVLLVAVLPSNVSIVGKVELTIFPPFKWLLDKLGHLTVNRFDFGQSLSDLTKIEEAIKERKSILIFPEGTFTTSSGVRPFKLGAFKLAVDHKISLCPIAISGTRKVLKGKRFLFHPAKIKVSILKSVKPKKQVWDEVIRLRDLVRQDIGQETGEPLLVSVLPDPFLDKE